jgi:hypothetical protein
VDTLADPAVERDVCGRDDRGGERDDDRRERQPAQAAVPTGRRGQERGAQREHDARDRDAGAGRGRPGRAPERQARSGQDREADGEGEREAA